MIPKFRAWHKTWEEMGKVKRIRFDDEGNVTTVLFEGKLLGVNTKIDEIELMQSTGLRDKNGKEIFEGDILFGHAGEDFWEVVEFDTEEGKWIRRDIWYNSKLDLSENNEFMEIIGNIYENPELLEVE